MKFLHYSFALALVGALVMTSCDKDDDKDVPQPGPTLAFLNFERNQEATQFSYTPGTGQWTQYVDPLAVDNLTYGNMNFSHSVTFYGELGVYNGFCPSISSDVSDYSAEDTWPAHQWSNITGTGLAFAGNAFQAKPGVPFMVANWSVSESTTSIPAKPSLKIKPINGKDFKPYSLYITNSTYAYYGMLNGTNYSKKFGPDDYCYVIAIGVEDGRETGRVKIPLYAKGEYLKTWKAANLRPLGEVDYIYFQMESSDSGQWGMNNPAYFCIGALSFIVD